MAWRHIPTLLGLLGGAFAAHVSLRDCVSPSVSPDELDGGGVSQVGVCAVGSTQACNTYGTQTCIPGGSSFTQGVWGSCSCSASPTCTPGAAQGCGNCGTQSCNACGAWSTCLDQGLCTPGDKGPDGCYEGEDAFCNESCQWVCP